MKGNVKRNIISLAGIIIVAFILTVIPHRHLFSQSCPTPSINDYTAYPVFVGQTVPPAVLILLDNSGSMNEFAYKSGSSPYSDFNPATTYYGYFNSIKKYSYSTTAGGHFYEDTAGGWDGNFLNWLTMRRVDVVRKVLVGGKATPRSGGVPNYLSVDSSDRDYYKKYAVANTYAPFSGTRCFRIGVSPATDIEVSTNTAGTCSSFTAGDYNIKVKFSATEEPLGVVQATWDKVRYGLMVFNQYGAYYEGEGRRDGSQVLDNILTSPGANINLRTHIENLTPETWTPLGESLYEATRYFRALMSAYGGGNYAAQDPVTNSCQKNFVIVLTDGESTKDRNLPGTCFSGTGPVTDPQGFNVQTWMDSIATNEGYASQKCTNANTSEGTYYLEGVAFWSHVTDLRDGTGGTPNTSGKQNITTYTVFAFDDSAVGRDLTKKSAKYGGFEDRNGNNTPDLQAEWDEDGDGVPDTYFEAQEGAALESALISAITDILRRASSGTSASVVASTVEGEGAAYQAYFIPSKYEGTQEIRWLGYLQGLFLDKYGNLREDTNNDDSLSYTDDYIVSIYFDTSANETFAKRYADSNGDGTADTLIDTVPISNISTIWEAGRVLWDRNLSTNPRIIKTTIDGTNMIDFSTTNASTLRPYLRASTDAEASNIISYIKGTDITNYRSRTITISGTSNVWKLGDIAHSTPTTVSKPAENYDLLYKDSTYTTFKQQYAKRRHVVYAGANDGMLHAFNAGFFDSSSHKFWRAYSGGTYSDTGPLLGEELFAFIPQSLLPHLKWLTDTNYTHVYYVDLKPKVVDVRIFTPDSTHPNGWGTVLIGGMRFGGKEICVSDAAFTGGSQTFYSAYFALDITNPEDSVSYGRLLWTFTHTDLALTTSYPAVLRTGLGDQAGTWYVVFGSGPTAYDGSSTKAGNIFVVNLSSGALAREFTDSALMTRAFMADTMTVDVNMDYQVDVIYIGNTYCDSASGCTSSTWKGKMYRIDTSGNGSTPSTDPVNWVLTTFYDPAQPVTSAPAAALDDLSNLWIFFGTGRFLSTDDKSFGTTDKWSFYGIKDLCKPWMNTVICTQMPLTDYPLFDASNVVVSTDQTVTGAEAGAGGTFSGMVNLINSYRGGWYVNFATAGERSLFKPLVIGGLVIWTTYIPSTDLCAFEGSSRLYATYYKTGTAYYEYVFEQTGITVIRDISLGTGVPSSPAATVTGESTIMGFVQSSSGAIVQIEQTTPYAVKSGFAGWKQEIIP